MIVFKTFWKVVKKYKGMIFLYTALLLLFGGLNTKSNDTSLNFVDSKPDVMIVNEDVDGKITKNLVDYLKNHTNVVEEKKTEEEILDAIFYREVNYVIYIPKNYGSDVMNQNDPSVTIRSTGDYQASLASMLLERYLKTQDVFVKNDMSEEEIIKSVNEVLQTQVEVSITSQLDANELNQVTQYFNFASYTLMAVVIFIVCLVLSSFHESKVSRRIQVSKMNYRKHNSFIILASSFYTMMVFVLFGVLGFVLFGHTLLSYRGFLYLFNAFLFLFVSLTLAVLISNLVHNKEAVSGIVNVVALGSAFLCGAFVPMEWLPKSVVGIAHALPAYWYIAGNEFLKTTETLQGKAMTPLFQNMFFLVLFGVLFLIINLFVLRLRQKRNG